MKNQLPVYRVYFNSEAEMQVAKDKLFAVHGVEADDVHAIPGEATIWKLIYANDKSHVVNGNLLGVKTVCVQCFDPLAQWDRGFVTIED